MVDDRALPVVIDADDAADLARLALVGWHALARRGEQPSPRARAFAESLARWGQERSGVANFAPLVDDSPHDADVALLPASAAASMLSVSPRTLRRMAADGRLCPVKVRGATRYRRADVVRLIEEA